MSDHMLVEAHLRLVALRHHQDASHRVTVEVTSADAQNINDCVWGLCNPLDLYANMDLRYLSPPGVPHAPGSPLRTPTCEGWTLAVPPSACGAMWTLSADQDPASEGFRSSVVLWDDDGPLADDELFTVEGNQHPQLVFRWIEGMLEMRTTTNPWYMPASWRIDRPYHDPLSWCSRAGAFTPGSGNQAQICLRVSIDEVAP